MAGASHTAHLHTKQRHTINHLASSFSQTLCSLLLSQRLPADERPDALSCNGSHGHGHGLRCGQPIGVVIAGCKVADIVDVAEHEGHGAEPAKTAAGRA